MPGILTGVMLAVARAAGETAPLLFTALLSDIPVTVVLNENAPLIGSAYEALAALGLPVLGFVRPASCLL